MKRLTIFIFILSIICFYGCNTNLEDPDSVDPEKSLILTSVKTSIASGGVGVTRIIARLPEKAGVIDVTFSTSAGSFVQVGAKSIKQLSDSLAAGYRYAAVTLVSDATKGTVYLTAEAKTSRARTTITFE